MSFSASNSAVTTAVPLGSVTVHAAIWFPLHSFFPTFPFFQGARGPEPLVALPTGTDLDSLEPRMRDVMRVAGWLGFLRWVQAQDPQGVARLRRELQPAPQSGAGPLWGPQQQHVQACHALGR